MTVQATSAGEQRAARLGRASRIVLVIVVALVVVVAALIFLYSRSRADRSTPLAFKVFPGAAISGAKLEVPGGDEATYTTAAAFAAVYNFYVTEYGDRIEERSNGTSSGCVDASLDQENLQAKCILDNSQEQDTQRVLIELSVDKEKKLTVIKVTRDWAK